MSSSDRFDEDRFIAPLYKLDCESFLEPGRAKGEVAGKVTTERRASSRFDGGAGSAGLWVTKTGM